MSLLIFIWTFLNFLKKLGKIQNCASTPPASISTQKFLYDWCCAFMQAWTFFQQCGSQLSHTRITLLLEKIELITTADNLPTAMTMTIGIDDEKKSIFSSEKYTHRHFPFIFYSSHETVIFCNYEGSERESK